MTSRHIFIGEKILYTNVTMLTDQNLIIEWICGNVPR